MGNLADSMNLELVEILQKHSKSEVMTKMEIEIIIEGIKSSNIDIVFECIKVIRRLLSISNQPDVTLIETIVARNIIPICVSYLDANYHPELIYETTWLLLNISTGNEMQTLSIIHAGGIPKLINLLTNSNQKIIEVAAWTLSNISCDGSNQRDLLFANGVVDKIALVLNNPLVTDATLKVLTWLCSNLCHPLYFNQPKYWQVQALIPPLTNLLDRKNKKIMKSSSQALRHIFRNAQSIHDALNLNLLEKLQKMFESTFNEVIYEGVLILSTISKGSHSNADQILSNSEFVESFLKILSYDEISTVKEVTWALFRLMSRASSLSVRNLVNHANFFNIVMDLLEWENLQLNNVVNLLMNLLRDQSGITYLNIEE